MTRWVAAASTATAGAFAVVAAHPHLPKLPSVSHELQAPKAARGDDGFGGDDGGGGGAASSPSSPGLSSPAQAPVATPSAPQVTSGGS